MRKIYRFTASWCGPCKMLAKMLEGEDLGVDIEVVDIDEKRELCEQYNIRGVPTLLDVESGETLVGMSTLPDIKRWIDALHKV